REIQNAAFEAQKKVDSGEQGVVGVNCFKSQEDEPVAIHKLDRKIVKDQLTRLKSFKAKRRAKVIESHLKRIEREAVLIKKGESSQVTQTILEAVEDKCTLGEIADVMRAVGGTYAS